MLPAVPTLKLKRPATGPPGLNTNSLEPGNRPSVSAPELAATARAAVTCCACKPGLGRLSRIFVIFTSFRVRADRAMVVRTIWPPPSSMSPGISINDPRPPCAHYERFVHEKDYA